MQSLVDSGTIWILIPLTALMIPIVAIVLEPVRQRFRMNERREARQMYERLAAEKLDLLKTAVAMGYSHNDLADLDARLERLIGSDKLGKLLSVNQKELKAAELASAEVAQELARQQRKVEGKQGSA